MAETEQYRPDMEIIAEQIKSLNIGSEKEAAVEKIVEAVTGQKFQHLKPGSTYRLIYYGELCRLVKHLGSEKFSMVRLRDYAIWSDMSHLSEKEMKHELSFSNRWKFEF